MARELQLKSAMTKKDYERAARIIQERFEYATVVELSVHLREKAIEVLVELFSGDNPRFDEARFRAACVPGANVKARS